MFRTSAARGFCRPCPVHNASMSRLSTCAQLIKVRTSFTGHKKLSRSPTTRALALRNPPATSLVRYQTTRSINRDQESKQLQQRLHPEPESVSTDSTVRSVFHEKGEEDAEPEIEMSAGIKQDFVRIISDTGEDFLLIVQFLENHTGYLQPSGRSERGPLRWLGRSASLPCHIN